MRTSHSVGPSCPEMRVLGLLWAVFAQFGAFTQPLPPGALPVINPTDPCIEVKGLNQTAVRSLPNHKYMVLEHCLYYHLQSVVDAKQRQPNAIAILPPSDMKEQKNITVGVNKMILQHYYLNEFMQDFTINGYFEVTWNDPRLTWREEDWNTKVLNIQTSSHIWVPQLNSQQPHTAIANADLLEFRRIRLHNGGNISAYLNFRMHTFCQLDVHNFPNDIYDCCYHIQPAMYSDFINFKAPSVAIHIDDKYYRNYGWTIDSVPLRSIYDKEGLADLNMCLRLKRSSTTLSTELALPMTICAILTLIAPFFGSFERQTHVKFFALLLQFLCLQFLTTRMGTHLSTGSRSPRIFVFYEFTIAMNLGSIICTLIVWLCARQKRELPPPNRVASASELFNRFLFFMIDDFEQKDEVGQAAHSSKTYERDWLQAFRAIHNLLMLVLMLAYLIGVAIIYG